MEFNELKIVATIAGSILGLAVIIAPIVMIATQIIKG